MITRMTGRLVRVLDEEVRLQVGDFEFQILVPETVRRLVQGRIGQTVAFHITEYLESTSGGNRFIPRRIGFLSESECELFELLCTVEKIGAKKALKAMARSVRDIVQAIQRHDARWLSTLPGIGPTTAEQIVATLKRKVADWRHGPDGEEEDPTADTEATPPAAPGTPRPKGKAGKNAPTDADDPATLQARGRLIEDVYEAMLGLGHSPAEARARLDTLLTSGQAFATVDEALRRIYGSRNPP